MKYIHANVHINNIYRRVRLHVRKHINSANHGIKGVSLGVSISSCRTLNNRTPLISRLTPDISRALAEARIHQTAYTHSRYTSRVTIYIPGVHTAFNLDRLYFITFHAFGWPNLFSTVVAKIHSAIKGISET